jgi:acyl carrier protein phosphodiesterase
MNILIHLFFSQNDENVIIGNFIADYIRGLDRLKIYSPKIQSGIKLHQWIDNYSDKNIIVKKSISLFSPSLKHYAPVAVDVIYDHFMSNNWEKFSNKSLHNTISDFYLILKNNYNILPSRAKKAVDHMISNNWLMMYKDIAGLKHIFEWMDSRASFNSNLTNSIEILLKNYLEIENDFHTFMSQMIIDFEKIKLEIKKES